MSTCTIPHASRFPLIDGLKAIAMQFILLHHMAAYGPLADSARQVLPDLVEWLYDYARMAVQVFLVLGGYLAARAFDRGFGEGRPSVAQLIVVTVGRYLRLVLPFVVALLLAMICSAIARRWVGNDDFIPASPGVAQFLAHGLLMQSLLGYESLSAGVWYVAIDFQLFVLFAGVVWIADRVAYARPSLKRLDVILVALLTLASLFHFNLDGSLDDWAFYFFGAYGLGILAYWSCRGRRGASVALGLVLVAMPLALMVDFRWRLVIALATAMITMMQGHLSLAERWCRADLIAHLGRTSYALLLIQFPVYLLTTAVSERLGLLEGPGALTNALYALIVAWTASLWAADMFYRWIEVPAGRVRLRWQQPSSTTVHKGPSVALQSE